MNEKENKMIGNKVRTEGYIRMQKCLRRPLMDFFLLRRSFLGCVKQVGNNKSLASSNKSRNFEITKLPWPIWCIITEWENNVFLIIRTGDLGQHMRWWLQILELHCSLGKNSVRKPTGCQQKCFP
jgi:hypothetical protein